MKTCTKCGQPRALERFAIDRAKRDGRDSWCRDCRNKARRDAYRANHDREKLRSRDYYADHRDQRREKVNAYNATHRAELAERAGRHYAENRIAILARQRGARDPQRERVRYMNRHGGIDEWARMWDEQGGCCYLCGETLEDVPQKMIAVDHDHECCPGGKVTKSCGACRRGLAHGWCNQLIGLAGEDMGVLRAIIANFERVNAETKRRIASKPTVQDVLSADVDAATTEARLAANEMPDPDMPVGASWPARRDESALF